MFNSPRVATNSGTADSTKFSRDAPILLY